MPVPHVRGLSWFGVPESGACRLVLCVDRRTWARFRVRGMPLPLPPSAGNLSAPALCPSKGRQVSSFGPRSLLSNSHPVDRTGIAYLITSAVMVDLSANVSSTLSRAAASESRRLSAA